MVRIIAKKHQMFICDNSTCQTWPETAFPVLTSVFIVQRTLTEDGDGNFEGEHTNVACPLAVVNIKHPVQGEVQAQWHVHRWRFGRRYGLVEWWEHFKIAIIIQRVSKYKYRCPASRASYNWVNEWYVYMVAKLQTCRFILSFLLALEIHIQCHYRLCSSLALLDVLSNRSITIKVSKY